jgi:hypothetical protein
MCLGNIFDQRKEEYSQLYENEHMKSGISGFKKMAISKHDFVYTLFGLASYDSILLAIIGIVWCVSSTEWNFT